MQRILIIEDDARLAQMIDEYLRQSGYTVHQAGTGRGGLAFLQDHQGTDAVDLIILDLMLPDIDGLELCRQIRALPSALAKTAVVMLTAKGDPMDRVIGLEVEIGRAHV